MPLKDFLTLKQVTKLQQALKTLAAYCFLCGESLRDRCECGRAITDWHYSFCPYCGKGHG